MEKIEHTFESVWTAFAETDRLIKELRDTNAQSSADLDRKMAETDRKMAETDRRMAETDRKMAETDRQIKQLGKMIGGLSNNHGLFAEEYFYNAFKRGKKNFFGEKFDKILRSETLEDDRTKAEFDLLLVNGKSVALIEVKFRTRGKTVDQLMNKIKNFRLKFPEYQNHQVYLGIASMVFEDKMEYECIDHGIAVIKQVGDTVVIHDENIRAF